MAPEIRVFPNVILVAASKLFQVYTKCVQLAADLRAECVCVDGCVGMDVCVCVCVCVDVCVGGVVTNYLAESLE